MNEKKPQPGAESLEAILGRVLSHQDFKQKSKLQKIRRQWAKAVETKFLDETRVVSLRQGVLRVEVSHSSILLELSSFHKPAIIISLNEALATQNPSIRDIKFVLGAW